MRFVKKHKWLLFFLIGTIGLVADILTKELAIRYLTIPQFTEKSVKDWNGFLTTVHSSDSSSPLVARLKSMFPSALLENSDSSGSLTVTEPEKGDWIRRLNRLLLRRNLFADVSIPESMSSIVSINSVYLSDTQNEPTVLEISTANRILIEFVFKGNMRSYIKDIYDLELGGEVPVLGDVLSWHLVYNKGMIFGLRPQNLIKGFPVNTVFSVFSVIAVIILIFYYHFTGPSDVFTRLGLCFILPGALGNFYDRIFHASKGVVDFIKVNLHFPPFDPWPIFNFADAYITVGVSLIFISMFFEHRARKNVEPEENQPDSANEIKDTESLVEND